jgi:hypothetical protein
MTENPLPGRCRQLLYGTQCSDNKGVVVGFPRESRYNGTPVAVFDGLIERPNADNVHSEKLRLRLGSYLPFVGSNVREGSRGCCWREVLAHISGSCRCANNVTGKRRRTTIRLEDSPHYAITTVGTLYPPEDLLLDSPIRRETDSTCSWVLQTRHRTEMSLRR